jgi:hypothetical protein
MWAQYALFFTTEDLCKKWGAQMYENGTLWWRATIHNSYDTYWCKNPSCSAPKISNYGKAFIL